MTRVPLPDRMSLHAFTCLGIWWRAYGSFVTIHALIVLKDFLFSRIENWKRIVATVCESYQSSNQTWRTVDGLLWTFFFILLLKGSNTYRVLLIFLLFSCMRNQARLQPVIGVLLATVKTIKKVNYSTEFLEFLVFLVGSIPTIDFSKSKFPSSYINFANQQIKLQKILSLLDNNKNLLHSFIF